MADFRKLFLALVVMAVATATAFGQVQPPTFGCATNSAVPTTLRGGGITERLGDLTLLCQGGTVGGTVTASFVASISLPVGSVTNKILDTTTNQIGATLEVLNSIGAVQSTVNGILGSNGLVTFPSVTVPTGTTGGAFLRISNIRVNAGSTNGTPVYEFISVSGASSVPVTNAQFPVGFVVSPAFTFSASAGVLQQCTSTTATGTLTFASQIGGVFKSQADEGTDATIADRLIANFAGIPANVTLTLQPQIVIGGYTLTLVTGADANGAGGAAVTDLTTAVDLKGSAAQTVVYEVTTSVNAPVSLAIPVGITVGTGASSGSSITVAGSLGPISTVLIADPKASVPRFVANAQSAPGSFLTINPCATNLLFPYVTNASGWDTGIAISNTSEDATGTLSTTGDCMLNFFGANAPSAATLSAIAPGKTQTLDLNSVPGIGTGDTAFSGYVVAKCNFQYAHAVAIILSANGSSIFPSIAPALVIPDRGVDGKGKRIRFADSFSNQTATTNNQGEQLAQ